jgi:lipid II:glycine glycyltransferase (peptidoglycan interpeptide bridge formation enzyme)
MNLVVKEISKELHHGFLADQPSFSFLQLPEWALVKSEWRGISIGFFDKNDLIGVGLILERLIPKINYAFWYLPEGPVINNEYLLQVEKWVPALKTFCLGKKVFMVKFGPRIIENTFEKEEIEYAIESGLKNFDEIRNTPSEVVADLRKVGCQHINQNTGFGDVQPRFIFIKDIYQKTDDELLKEFNQQWRRNIKKANNSQILVRVGSKEDLPTFHEIYKETAIRDGFTPRPLWYFEKMLENLNTESSEIRVYLAFKDEKALAGTIWIKVKNHVWYSYGASSNEGRDFKPSNAIQWQMIKDARDAGAEIYDFRGISDSLDVNNHLFGLLRFKLGTGGKAVKYIGEWDLVLNKFVYKLFMFLLKFRGKK